MLGGGERKSISSTASFRSCTERECCFGAGDCEGSVRPGPVLCVNVPPFFNLFSFFFLWFLWLVFYFSPPVIMSCCFVSFVLFFFVFYVLSPDCFLSLYVHLQL